MLFCRPTPSFVAFVAVAVAVNDQVNDHAHVNEHASRTALPSN
jgi:hypothetical protein